MVTTCIIFLFHNTSHWCFLPPSDLLTTHCDGKIIYSAAFNDFHSFFQCFCGPISLNFAFLHLFSSPTSLYTCVEVSVSGIFCFFDVDFLKLISHHYFFFSVQLYQSCSCFFFFFRKNSVLCSYLLSLGLLISVLCSLVLICFLWDFSLLDLCSLGTFLGLGWVEILLLLLLCIGFWGELAHQGEAQ